MERTWDLSFLYKSFDDPAFLQDLKALPEDVRRLSSATEGEGSDVEKLETMVSISEDITRRMEHLGGFCYFTLSVDAENAQAMRYLNQIQVLGNDVSLAMSEVQRFVQKIGNLEECIAASPLLASCGFALREMKEQACHLMDPAIEKWMLKMQLSGGQSFSRLRDQLDATHLVEYRGEKLPLSAVRGKAYDADAGVRRDAYEAELASYKAIELPMSYCLNSIKMEARTLAEARGYSSVLDMTLSQSRMDRECLDAMWSAIEESLPAFRRYLRKKGELLGHSNGLPFYDLFAPVGNGSLHFTLEEAHQKLLEEMGKFTPDMAAFMDHAFLNRWIDVDPRPGKSGGAFCAGIHDMDRSLILTNFQGSFSDVSTLAHELGHAWHNRCMAGLPALMTQTPMPLAETASIFNETVLSHQVLSSCPESLELNLLESGLMECTQTVVDIYSRFLFEREVVDTRADHAMSVEELKDCMIRAQKQTYGDGLDPDFMHPYMWACKSHYYSSDLNFYNFPYAFGLLFGKGVFARYLAEGVGFVPVYCQLLRSCGSDTITNVAASVGIDVRSRDFWRSSLRVIEKDIDRFCDLASAR